MILDLDKLDDGDIIIFVNQDKVNEKTYSHKGRLRDGNRIIFFRLYEKESTSRKSYLKGFVYKIMEVKK